MGASGEQSAGLLGARDRERALALLAGDAARNLLLIEIVDGLGRRVGRGEVSPQVVGVFVEDELVSVASVRPTVVLDHSMSDEAIELVRPFVARLRTGLIKSARAGADRLWSSLAARGREALVDRTETAYRCSLPASPPPTTGSGASVRCAESEDLEELVHAARASLREERRPDPFDGDPTGFRQWVLGRVPRARVVDVEGRAHFVAYADVRRRDGWLVQGVYTWPEARRRGFAKLGMRELMREATAAGADHIQLAVVDGNEPAIELYEGLGFTPFDELRTILFV